MFYIFQVTLTCFFISHQVVISIKQYNILYIVDLKPVIQNVLNNKPFLLLFIGIIIVISI